MDKMMRNDISHLPVVSPKNPKKIVGFLTKGDIMKIYYRTKITEEMRIQLKLSRFSRFSKRSRRHI
jgi:CBS domain-containing protein